MVKKSGLGRGLSALIPVRKDTDHPGDRYEEIAVSLLDPNPEQPRHRFHEDRLQELANSIKHNGVIQPIIVTQAEERYIVIAGERRWRATRLAGYTKIPAIIRNIEKGRMLSLALLENIQRQELNPVEEALAYRKLLDTNNFTHETLAAHLGKSRVTISNTVRLLKLSDSIKNLIQDNQLSFGHARCLVTIEDQERVNKLAKHCVDKQWSVRDLEKRIQLDREQKKPRDRPRKDPLMVDLEKSLSRVSNGKVTIVGSAKQGKIVFTYGSGEVFEQIVEAFLGKEREQERDG